MLWLLEVILFYTTKNEGTLYGCFFKGICFLLKWI